LKVLIEQIEALGPNARASERFDEVKARLTSTTEEWESRRAELHKASEAFDKKRSERREKFMRAFNHVASVIDAIYKQLTRSKNFEVGGKAYLTVDNAEEPFLHGIKYTTMPPMKRFRDMDQLSGGEKTVAALALLFAIHRSASYSRLLTADC
jgi:structural maintenance of chromosome 1